MNGSLSRLLVTASLTAVMAATAQAQSKRPVSFSVEPAKAPAPPAHPPKTAALSPDAGGAPSDAAPKSLVVAVLLADVGYSEGFRLSNLGGRREIYVPVPQGAELGLGELVLALDDVSAHEARRSLEILVNDRAVAAFALDGKSTGRSLRIPLTDTVARDGFLKVSFVYSGAATQDRCIDVRYVGDSVTVRPESAVEFDIGLTGPLNITATAALLPHEVTVLLSNPQPPKDDIAAALTLARSLAASGRHVTFRHGLEALPELTRRADPHRWTNGLVIVGTFDRVASRIDQSVASAAAVAYADETLMAARVGGAPVLLVSDAASARAGRLLGNPSLAVLRDTPAASVRLVAAAAGPADRVSFDELGVAPVRADVFGRAELAVAIARRTMPGGTRPSRLLLDIMVAPDGAGEKAVVSAFVNERLLASTVAAIGEPTRLDIALPDGLVGTVANIRAVVQRRSAQGDCRFEPQGYPAEILGSSSFLLSKADPGAEDFSDFATLWSNGIEVLVPASSAARPLQVLGLLADVLDWLSKETAPISVKYIGAGTAPAPGAPFIAVSDIPPAGATQRVHFDRGRVAIADRAGRARLDVGGLATGAVAQIVSSGPYSGLWIRPLAGDGSLPVSPKVDLDHGDVAFLDKTGVALAMSTERDTLLRISYPEQGSWFGFADRYRSWIVAGCWAAATVSFLLVLQRIYRRRRRSELADAANLAGAANQANEAELAREAELAHEADVASR